MDKIKLIEILRSLLNTDLDFTFLLKLKEEDIEKLVASVREKVDG